MGSLQGITLLMLSIFETPGCNSIVRVLFTFGRTPYGPLALLPNLQGFHFFLSTLCWGTLLHWRRFWFCLMRFSFIKCSCLCVIVCQSATRGILRNMSLLNVWLLGLLPRVECIVALVACTAMDKASSMYSLVLAISWGGSLCNHVLETFLTIWCILLHTALDWWFLAVVHTSLMWQFCNKVCNSCPVTSAPGSWIQHWCWLPYGTVGWRVASRTLGQGFETLRCTIASGICGQG